MSPYFSFAEIYKDVPNWGTKVTMSGYDLQNYFAGLRNGEAYEILLHFLVRFLADDPPEQRHLFRDRVVNIIEFLQDEIFEDDDDFSDFLEARYKALFEKADS